MDFHIQKKQNMSILYDKKKKKYKYIIYLKKLKLNILYT